MTDLRKDYPEYHKPTPSEYTRRYRLNGLLLVGGAILLVLICLFGQGI